MSLQPRKGLTGTAGRRNRRAVSYTLVSILLLLAGPLLLGGAGGWLGARFSDLLYASSESPTEDELRAELLQLMLENSQLREEAIKADSYRTLLGMTRTSDREALGARVLYRTEGLVSGSMVIDRGYEDGVVANSACISFQGLVGVVSTVGPRTSEVLPITNPSINVSCVTWPSGAAGILESTAEGELRLVHVDLAGGAGTGDQVLTSRFSGIYPDGLLVGTVTGISSGEPGLALELTVEPSVDFSRLGEILILLPVDSIGPSLE